MYIYNPPLWAHIELAEVTKRGVPMIGGCGEHPLLLHIVSSTLTAYLHQI